MKFKEIILSPAQIERFWTKVDFQSKDQCWNWKAGLYPKGYGKYPVHMGMDAEGKQIATSYLATRVAWVLTNGPIPNGLLACHKCDNPKCCNPSHLFLGTHQDNTKDAFTKGRIVRKSGEGHWGSKLNFKLGKEIRERYLNGPCTQQELAEEYHVSESTIYNVVHSILWGEQSIAA